MSYKHLFLSMAITVVIGCSDEAKVIPTKSGYFTLSHLKTQTNGRVNSIREVATEFNLGDLKASKEFYFLLGNNGENPITDITLETDDPRFVISPKNISELGAPNSTGSNIIPLISIGIIHGSQLNGVGFTEILEMGEHSIKLKVTGKTIEDGVTINLAEEFGIKVNAKVMDISLSDSGAPIDLLSPDIFASGVIGAGGLGLVPGYPLLSNTVRIKNTGNISFKVILHSFATNTSTSEILVAPNQTQDITVPTNIDNNKFALLSLDGDGAITDYARIKLGNDGKGYIVIH